MSEVQEPFFKSPKNLIIGIIFAFAIPVIVIALLINYVNTTSRTGAGTDSMTTAAISARLAPVATVEVRDANAPRVYQTGEQLFKSVCAACHATGTAGAPKFGNAADWAPRIAQGYDTLVKTALSGLNAMPARGGTSPDDVSDYEIARAVVYMANAGGAHFADPPVPAPTAASGAAAATTAAATPTSPASAAPAPAPATTAMTASTPAAPSPAPSSSAPAVAAAPATAPTTGMSAVQVANADANADTVGKALFTQTCSVCHATGVAGAPKFGSKDDWGPRLTDSIDTIYNYALHGKGAMPPKGGAVNASDADVKAAVNYMIKAVGK